MSTSNINRYRLVLNWLFWETIYLNTPIVLISEIMLVMMSSSQLAFHRAIFLYLPCSLHVSKTSANFNSILHGHYLRGQYCPMEWGAEFNCTNKIANLLLTTNQTKTFFLLSYSNNLPSYVLKTPNHSCTCLFIAAFNQLKELSHNTSILSVRQFYILQVILVKHMLL